MSKQLTENQRGLMAEKLMRLANLLFAGCLLVLLLDKTNVPWLAAIVGVASFAGLYTLALRLMQGDHS